MKFYGLDNKITEINIDDISDEFITIGYIESEKLKNVSSKLNITDDIINSCQQKNPLFRTDIEVHDHYTFSELRIAAENGNDDWIAIYLRKNFLLVVDINDKDNSTKNKFLNSINRFSAANIKFEKIVCSFIESLISDGTKNIELMRNKISDMEENVVNGSVDTDFNAQLLNEKKKILKLQNYYEQILDVTETLEENNNDIFDDEHLIYVANLSKKVTRLKDDVDALHNSADHLQDSYSSLLDMRLNKTMKIFTVITAIFFPLTIIVGWYGMNFKYMPEISWRFGYLYVIVLSIIIVVILTIVGKKRKWF